jgi:hypothetical protein
MAGIDKTYVDWETYKRLKDFIEKTYKKQEREIKNPIYLYEQEENYSGDRPVWNTSTLQDLWLAKNCKEPAVIERLKEQYDSNWIGFKKLDFKYKCEIMQFNKLIYNIDSESVYYGYYNLNDNEIQTIDKVLVYGTTIFEKQYDEALRILSGLGNDCVGFSFKIFFFGLHLTYKNKKWYDIDENEVVLGYFSNLNHFKFPKIKHSFKKSDFNKYSKEEIYLSFENEFHPLSDYKNYENLEINRIIGQLPPYLKNSIK